MKLPKQERKPPVRDTTPRGRLVEDVRTQLYRLTVLIDEFKTEGTVAELDAAEKVLWGAIRILESRRQR